MTRQTEILLSLEDERAQRPDLAGTLDLYLALMAVRAEESASVPVDWPERARLRLERGEIALSSDDVVPYCSRLRKLAQEICRVAATHRPEASESFDHIAGYLAAVSMEEMRRIVVAYLEWRDPDLEVDHELFPFVMHHALHPFLQAYAALAAPMLTGLHWLRGNCPICGGRPDFAALERAAGERRLLCARCDSDWAYRRIGCPLCDNDDPATLGYFLIGKGAYRLYVCERCKGYLKTIDMREKLRVRPLPVERILTVGMDLAAAEHGYRRS